jgi:hypothetical protein
LREDFVNDSVTVPPVGEKDMARVCQKKRLEIEFMNRLSMTTSALAVFLAGAVSASASTLSGEFWDVTASSGLGAGCQVNSGTAGTTAGSDAIDCWRDVEAILGLADPEGNARGPDATFTSTGLSYPGAPGSPGSGLTANTLAEWLGPTDALTLNPIGTGTTGMLGSIFRFTGWIDINDGETLSIGSDDGYSLTIGTFNALLDETRAFPGTLDTVTYSGASGLQEFELIFWEDNRTEVDLLVEFRGGVFHGDPAPIPLPAAAWMLLAGLGGLVAVKRRTPA